MVTAPESLGYRAIPVRGKVDMGAQPGPRMSRNPHVRGEIKIGGFVLTRSTEQSPHTWGDSVPGGGGGRWRRAIPPYVGRSVRLTRTARQSPRDLHVLGGASVVRCVPASNCA